MTSKSAMTPSLSGLIAEIVPGVRPEHPLRLDADRVHLAGALVDRDDGRLGEHDPAPAHVHERVCSTEVDGHVTTAEAGQGLEERHEGQGVYLRVFQQLRRVALEERHEQRPR